MKAIMLAAALVLIQSAVAHADDRDVRAWDFIIGEHIVTNAARMSQEACFRIITKVDRDGFCFNNNNGEAFNDEEARAHLEAVAGADAYPVLRTK